MSAKDKKCKNFSTCGRYIYRDSKTGCCKPCFDAASAHIATDDPVEAVVADRQKVKREAELVDLRRKYDHALKQIAEKDAQLGALEILDSATESYTIEERHGSGTSEAMPFLVASDWHIEEVVEPRSVSGLNDFNPDIARLRSERFFQSGLRLVRLLGQDVKISTVGLPLLGDFITNDIHEELKDLTALQPAHALAAAQNMIISGLEFLLDHSPYDFVIPCHSGNHARTTKTTHFSAENGHSLEWLMYLHLAAYFRTEKRLKFIIPDGYHSYLNVYGKTIRFHHGHAIKYAGGIGGIFIPGYKAISQWEKGRHADLDVFGHFHQMKDGGNFLSNGSLIGFNGFALAIKADYELPRQTLFLMDKKRGRTCTWPILLN